MNANIYSVTPGVFMILLTVFAMALTDAFVKAASTDMTLWQLYVFRSAMVIPVLYLLARGSVNHWAIRWVILRSMALVLMYLAIYAAIPVLDLSVIAASLYTGPLFIVLFSAVFLRESITKLHWVAVFTGFVGVLVIVRPSSNEFQMLSLVPIAAAMLYAVAAILTRTKCTQVPATTLAFWLNVALMLFGAIVSTLIGMDAISVNIDYPFLFSTWSTMTPDHWQTVGILAVLMIVVSVGLAKAYQAPQTHIVATFDYAYIVFAAFWGYVFFLEVPDQLSIGGMVLIACAGIISLKATDDNQRHFQ